MNRATELINLAIDGAASEAELRELDLILASSPEAAATLASYQELASRLESVRNVEPPSILKTSILRAAADHHASTQVSFWAAIRDFAVARRPVLAFGSLVAAGLAIVLTTTLLHEPSAPPISSESISGAMRQLDSAAVVHRSPDGSLSASVRKSATGFSVEPAVLGSGPVTLAWEPSAALAPALVKGWDRSSETRMTASCANGTCPRTAFSQEKGSSVNLTLSRPDGVILRFSVKSE